LIGLELSALAYTIVYMTMASSLQHCGRRTGRWGVVGFDQMVWPSGYPSMPRTLLVSIVEDDLDFRESMRMLMRSLGYAVETFASAADFLASPHLRKTVCLISDVQMPGMDGLELNRSLIESGHAIPTILITAYPNDVDRGRALESGVVCYLKKPVDETLLKRCLHNVFDRDR
jgi:FixJ family two-component response regulator